MMYRWEKSMYGAETPRGTINLDTGAWEGHQYHNGRVGFEGDHNIPPRVETRKGVLEPDKLHWLRMVVAEEERDLFRNWEENGQYDGRAVCATIWGFIPWEEKE